MIVLDTHVLIWWVDDDPRLRSSVRDRIDADADARVSAIPLLVIATAVSLGRLVSRPTPERWPEVALSAAQVDIESLTPAVCLESVRLPGEFHRDPAELCRPCRSRHCRSAGRGCEKWVEGCDGVAGLGRWR